MHSQPGNSLRYLIAYPLAPCLNPKEPIIYFYLKTENHEIPFKTYLRKWSVRMSDAIGGKEMEEALPLRAMLKTGTQTGRVRSDGLKKRHIPESEEWCLPG
ncbi:hypothetical protein AVEN_22604-1 [Araneus ventricosus]|uniref:Uncharacterized protein n=1 Tax=Araneus ventricosus TaxID=182803 RepID=A0A4Y2HV33_ARAVE|nr:hypothetical protein AVEN_22604-1 [Araneus ventricosus]